jgi:hypothetical protein
MTGPQAVGRRVLALFLAPVLVTCLWIEVIAGTGAVWNSVQPGQASFASLALGMAFAACGPVIVLVTTIRTRSRLPSMTERFLRIEKWGLIVALPLSLFALAIIGSLSII